MTPDEWTLSEQMLDVSDGHELYVQDWGNKAAKTPIIFLHGGPGSGVRDGHKQNFNPRYDRVIFFDQRGCGRSTPYGELAHNNTQALVEDIATITTKLGVEQFALFGRSWGSFLALITAIAMPERVRWIVTGGIYLGTKAEQDLADSSRLANHFPDLYAKILTQTPAAEHKRPLQYLLQQVLNAEDPEAGKRAAYNYSEAISALLRLDDRRAPQNYETFDPTEMQIEAYYMLHHCFVPDNYIIEHAAALTMPIFIVQGRYDMVCLPEVAQRLADVLPNAQLVWTQAGHSNGDRSNADVTTGILAGLRIGEMTP